MCNDPFSKWSHVSGKDMSLGDTMQPSRVTKGGVCGGARVGCGPGSTAWTRLQGSSGPGPPSPRRGRQCGRAGRARGNFAEDPGRAEGPPHPDSGQPDSRPPCARLPLGGVPREILAGVPGRLGAWTVTAPLLWPQVWIPGNELCPNKVAQREGPGATGQEGSEPDLGRDAPGAAAPRLPPAPSLPGSPR